MVAHPYLSPLHAAAQSSDTPPTWGISGPAFLGLYVLSMIAANLITLTWVRRVRRHSPIDPLVARLSADTLTPPQVAMLVHDSPQAGRSMAVEVAYADLRAHRLLRKRGRGVPDLSVRRRMVKLDPVAAAVCDELGPKTELRPAQALARPGVRAAVDTARRDLQDRGLISPPGRVVATAPAYLLPLAVVVLGFARVAAGIANDRPTAFILILTVLEIALLIGLAVATTSSLTEAGAAALLSLRERHAHLDPRLDPAWTTYGAQSIVLATALFGTTAMLDADPDFAHSVGIYARPSSGGGGGGGDGCGGGGGGCGGGGCGGGGCGG